jgi:hypothetical protein
MTNPLLLTYAVYASVSLVLTIWLARTLFTNGAVFLEEVFAGDERLAVAVNRLLVVGFYLVNFGWAMLMLRSSPVADLTGAVEVVATKLGQLMLLLAAMHFANLFIFHRIRQHARLASAAPPVAPAMMISARPA